MLLKQKKQGPLRKPVLLGAVYRFNRYCDKKNVRAGFKTDRSYSVSSNHHKLSISLKILTPVYYSLERLPKITKAQCCHHSVDNSVQELKYDIIVTKQLCDDMGLPRQVMIAFKI